MGQRCGYLALMGALATGAERVYLHEEGMRLTDLAKDVESLVDGFKMGKRLGVIIRSEGANQTYTTDFMCALLEEEGSDYLQRARQFLAIFNKAVIRPHLIAYWERVWLKNVLPF